MIDVETPDSPGWWLKRLYRDLYGKPVSQRTRAGYARPAFPNECRVDRLDRLWSYFIGNPPLPVGAENSRPVFDSFIRKARANYAGLIVEAVLNRMRFLGVRLADDSAGDELARRIGQANELPILTQDVHADMLTMSDGFVIVGPPDEGERIPVITSEDPRQTITAHDPARPARVRAGMKTYRDIDECLDFAHVYTPGRVDRFFREGPQSTSGRVNPRSWFHDEERSGPYELPGTENLIPVTRFRNRFGMGEFESNTDLLDRINDTILRRMVIITLQAFRQRAVKGDFPERHPETGEKIDYDAIFSADPGALWRLPATAELWESAQADVTPIASAIRDDVKELAGCSQTPLHWITPDAANGSAEGASLMREGGTYKVEDRMVRADPRWLQVHRHAFLFAGERELAGKELTGLWAPAERFTLAERAAAAAQIGDRLPTEAVWTDVLQVDPARIETLKAQRDDDRLMGPASA